jgi:hypothetical protein
MRSRVVWSCHSIQHPSTFDGAMKQLLVLLSLLFASTTAWASHYVTLTSGEELVVAESSIIEISATASSAGSHGIIKIYRGTPTSFDILVAVTAPLPIFPVTGITKIKNAGGAIVTVKISTEEELKETVSGMVTLPAITGADYAVTLEMSSDLANWQPVAPGEFTGGATPQFFRVRMATAPAP